MKKIGLLFLIGTIAITACNNSSNQQEEKEQDTIALENRIGNGEIVFENATYDFGKVKEGEVVEHIFKFKNTGSEPVIISRVSTSCGCTSPEFTSTPVLPGKEGEVTLRFDSNGQLGVQQKIATVVSNAANAGITVQIKGEVI